MFVREQLVQPRAISKTALLTIEGELDDISGNGQTKSAHDLCTSIPAKKREHYLAPDMGHYGIFSGRRFREVVYPRICAFIRRHG
jgi:poly(3-hydroxybutyrate) depolymerase